MLISIRISLGAFPRNPGLDIPRLSFNSDEKPDRIRDVCQKYERSGYRLVGKFELYEVSPLSEILIAEF